MLDFVFSDVHGCYRTLCRLLDRYYDEKTMRLVCLGDYIDKGRYSDQVVTWMKNAKGIFLRGNHEQELIEYARGRGGKYWYQLDGKTTIPSLSMSLLETAELFESLPLSYETAHVFYSHAGVSIFPHDPDDPNDGMGLVWNRMDLAPIGKLQVYGHTPKLFGPVYDSYSNSYNIDTGVFIDGWLSALLIDDTGYVIDIYKEKADIADLEGG